MRRNIILIDFSLGGHRLSFFKDFSTVLINAGCHVYVLVPEAKKLEVYINSHLHGYSKYFNAVEFKELVVDKSAGTPMAIFRQLQKWRNEARHVQKVEEQFDMKVDLVFYSWLDYQFSRFIPAWVLDKVFPYKWMGLYFHPFHLRLDQEVLNKKANWRDYDSVLKAHNCKGVAVHDQAIAEGFRKRIGKPIYHFPETADDTPPDFDYPLYKELKEKAKGRLIVGMIGCESFKGTLTLKRVAQKVDSSHYFFAFLGVLPRQTFLEEDWQEFQGYIESNPENAYFRFEPIPEGSAYNAVFDAIDIPFLVYDHFISSSNRLTKATLFRKLVLASDNYCVGDDVKKYKLGVPVPPKDPEAAVKGLELLREKIESKDYPEEQWADYRELNSLNKLKERFSEILNTVTT